MAASPAISCCRPRPLLRRRRWGRNHLSAADFHGAGLSAETFGAGAGVGVLRAGPSSRTPDTRCLGDSTCTPRILRLLSPRRLSPPTRSSSKRKSTAESSKPCSQRKKRRCETSERGVQKIAAGTSRLVILTALNIPPKRGHQAAHEIHICEFYRYRSTTKPPGGGA